MKSLSQNSSKPDHSIANTAREVQVLVSRLCFLIGSASCSKGEPKENDQHKSVRDTKAKHLKEGATIRCGHIRRVCGNK